jgi:LAO/AO transport system kinase
MESNCWAVGTFAGDKIRVEYKDENTYIRPSASGDTLGGVARKTRENNSLRGLRV